MNYTRECKYCEASFTTKWRNQKYCTKICAYKFRGLPIPLKYYNPEIKCKTCNELFKRGHALELYCRKCRWSFDVGQSNSPGKINLKRVLADKIREQKNVCPGCRETLPTRQFSIDHIIPKNNGGTDDPKNIQALCFPCNSAKGVRSQEEFLDLTKPLRRAYRAKKNSARERNNQPDQMYLIQIKKLQ